MISRVELYNGTSPVLRAERELEEDPLQRLGIMLPGAAVGVDGYASLFLEDRPDRTDVGAAFEIGRGVPLLGGSIERGVDRFTGLYLKLRRPNVELGLGGGDRNGDLIGHAGLYLKGARWSAAWGGARGPGGVDFQHLAATWHPVERGTAPGAHLIAERRSADRYAAELMLVDRASFNHFAVWGQFGMAQWPHRRTFEAVGDVMRFVRPPIFLHGYTSGALAVSGRYDRVPGAHELILDARVFPVRAFRRASPLPPDPRTGVAGYVVNRVIPTIMIGAFRKTRAGTTTVLGEIGFPPVSVYVEVPTQEGARTYVFVQYRQGLAF